MANGFIKLDEESEEVVANIVKELIDRSLIQIAERKWRRIISCRVHDFAIEKSKNLNCFHISDGALIPNSRRLASYCGFQRLVSSDHSNLCLRSFLLCNLENEYAEMA